MDEFEKKCIAGGHKHHIKLLTTPTGEEIIQKQTNMHEINSYERIFNSPEDDPKHEENVLFQKFLPKYYGHILNKENENQCILHLENLL